jgi:hypothetical protein
MPAEKQGEETMSRCLLWPTGSILLGLLLAAAPIQAADKVEIKQIQYDELTRLIAAQKGKVVVIDFWADT